MEIKAQIFRDGTSQRNRLLQALQPDYVAVDERDAEDWLRFARTYATYLQYFDSSNQPDGDWVPFFPDDIQQMLDYMENPDAFADDESLTQTLAQPHLALFMTFLKLLRYPQQQFKNLTQRYLDFHYRRVLGLSEKVAIPDRVHVIFELAKRETERLIKKGTLFTAGPDREGVDRQYATDEDIVVNRSQIASVKTLYVEKIYIDLEILHGDRSQERFERMLRWALGSPNPGDRFPNYPDGAAESIPYSLTELETLYHAVREENIYQIADNDKNYILEQLFFTTIDEFKTCFALHNREIQQQQGNVEIIAPTDSEWDQVYALVEKAYKKKINRTRRSALQNEHEANGFRRMMRLALGSPNPGAPLPAMPDDYTTLEELLAGINRTPPERFAVQYVTEQLYLPLEDFRKIMATQQNAESGTGSGGEADAAAQAQAWSEVYRLVEKAQTKKENFTYPPIGFTEIQNLHGAAIAETKPDEPLALQRFQTFHTRAETHPFPGFAVTSPVLNLQEGQRDITLTLECRADSFNRGVLIDEILKQGIIPFDLYLSSEQGWLSIDAEMLRFNVGDFILEETLKSYRRDGVAPIYTSTAAEDLFDPELETIATDSATNPYIQVADGTLYQVVEAPGVNKAKLRYVGWLSGSNDYRKYANLSLSGGVELTADLVLNETKTEIEATSNRFRQEDENQFIVWGNGDIYKIVQFGSARRLGVVRWGYLPRDGNILPAGSVALKYPNLNFTTRTTILPALEMTGVVLETGDTFFKHDISQVLVLDTGQAVKITAVGDVEATVRELGILALGKERGGTIQQYRSSGLAFNSLQFRFSLDAEQPAIIGLPFDAESGSIDTPYPILKGVLKTIEASGQVKSLYQKLRSLCLEKVHLKVNVQDVQDIQLRNDRAILSSKSPFQPFDTSPKVGSGFYFSNLEISRKPLTQLTLHLEWMGLPENFAVHYDAYSKCGMNPPLPAIDNNSFNAQLKILHNRAWRNIAATQSLFSANEHDTLQPQTNLEYGLQGFSTLPNYTLNRAADLESANDPFKQSRYFKLELGSPDFQQKFYSLVLNKVALASEEAIKALTVYEPYQPELKSISLDYQASIEIDLTQEGTPVGQVFQLHPFGYADILASDTEQASAAASDRRYFLLPQYEQEGTLFLGIRDLKPPQNLSILMQMVSGSANVELMQPDIAWSYLSRDRWHAFQNTEILSDSTNGLVDSGIVRFSLPAAATNDNHLFPSGLHWLRATVQQNIEAIPDTLDIRAQAVTATFVDRGNAADCLSKPLAADSIQALVQRDAAIQSIAQPYSSFRGRMKENSAQFYQRASERLRHKQRAVTAWDYERLVLEQFPQIYKVKVLSQCDRNDAPNAAQVTAVVVPDIANTAPFFPLEPKVPLYLLKQIEAYLQAHTSPFVQVIVKNPRYEQIKYRIAVRFYVGYEQGYYLKQLNEEIKQFLSPWAYDGQADIPFGSSIHSSAVIHFVETRPYVDYVANLKLIEQVTIDAGNKRGTTTLSQVNTSNLAQVRYPDSILVSAPNHIIDIITTETYDAEEFEGIDYMIIGLDFVVG